MKKCNEVISFWRIPAGFCLTVLTMFFSCIVVSCADDNNELITSKTSETYGENNVYGIWKANTFVPNYEDFSVLEFSQDGTFKIISYLTNYPIYNGHWSFSNDHMQGNSLELSFTGVSDDYQAYKDSLLRDERHNRHTIIFNDQTGWKVTLLIDRTALIHNQLKASQVTIKTPKDSVYNIGERYWERGN